MNEAQKQIFCRLLDLPMDQRSTLIALVLASSIGAAGGGLVCWTQKVSAELGEVTVAAAIGPHSAALSKAATDAGNSEMNNGGGALEATGNAGGRSLLR